jgi:hypothetical protein
MGSKTQPSRTPGQVDFVIGGQRGPVAQLLHPSDACYTASQIAALIPAIDRDLNPSARLVLSGAGLMAINHDFGVLNGETLTSEETLLQLRGFVLDELDDILGRIGKLQRQYVLGFDVYVDGYNAGQFAVALVNERKPGIIWKSLPVGGEAGYLAGFGSPMGQMSPRIIDCCLGTALILVCHDAQSFNHRTGSLVGKQTARGNTIAAMSQMMAKERPNGFSIWLISLRALQT